MKYMGSKNRIAKEIYQVVEHLHKGRAWVEPFVGGGNMIQHIEGQRFANDSNIYVVALLDALSRGWVPSEITKQQYADIKANPQCYDAHMVGFAGICCSYSGKWFGGFAGITKTKGGLRNYQSEAIYNILKQAPKLSKIKFSNGCFSKMSFPSNSLVYCDPPYISTCGYKDKFPHDMFYKWLLKIVENNIVIVSEYTAPPGFVEIWQKPMKSSLSANGKQGANKNSVEKLFVHESQSLLF